ncbi:MAG: hypothetical protein ABIT37_05105 [Luteolibacter sp.]
MKSILAAGRLPATAFLVSLLCPALQAVPVRVLAWDDAIAGMRLALGDAKGSSVIESMHPSKRTRIYQLTAGEKPLVVEALDKKDPEGRPYTNEIKIPERIKQPLLVILPDAKAPTGVRLFVLDDDTSSFAWGSTRFINATGKQLVYVQEKKIVHLPSSWDPVQTDPGGTTRNMEVKFYFHDQPARAFYSAIWEYNTDLRMLVFLLPGEDPRSGPVAMKMIPEDRRLVLAAKEASAKADGTQP